MQMIFVPNLNLIGCDVIEKSRKLVLLLLLFDINKLFVLVCAK